VLCSDGLSSQVPKETIAEVVTEEDDISAACGRLIDLANEKGGPDNITVILARVDGPGLFPPADTDEVGHQVFPLKTGLTPPEPIDAYDIDPRVFPTEEMEATGLTGETADEMGDLPAARTPLPSPAEMLKKYTPVKPTPPEQPPAVSEARRSTGRSISVALLVLLIAGALWFLYHTIMSVTTSAPPGR